MRGQEWDWESRVRGIAGQSSDVAVLIAAAAMEDGAM
jgi:hypothetical protein